MDQELFQIIVTITGALAGWVLKVVWDAVKDLQLADKELTERIHEVETLVAGDYVRRDYLDCKVEAIFTKLDKIEDKMDRKADK